MLTTNTQQEGTMQATYEQQAYELGCQHARNAASWAYDGDMSQKDVERRVKMLDDGDPEVWDLLPQAPNLSGEWADSPTPTSLLHDFMPAGYMHDENADPVADGMMDALADAYERGVDETFQIECERILRAALDS